mmetsp:Transcript_139811/g.198021  ORF Transcript_139811/g.198021 Transcript_139811/m.198021 type:complete len:328 (-) Transcript_139811:189-1172(-)
MTIDLYPEIAYDLTPDVRGSDIDEAVERIYKACKGFGTDEKALIDALASCTPEQRCKVETRYEEVHGKELKKVMRSECGNRDFGTALQLLALPPDETEVEIIKRACKGMGTNELVLFPVVCGRSNKEIEHLKKKFFDIHSKDLGKYLDKELGGNFEKLIFNCLQGSEEEYDPGFHDDAKVDEDVAALYEMGQGRWGTNESGLFKILCSRPSEHLKKVNAAYADKHDVTLYHVMEKELGGDTKDATVFLLGMKLRPYETIVKLIEKATKGIGTNELLLSCTIIRYQICLKEVMHTYIEMKGDTLQELIKKEVGGDYRRLLLAICDNAM